jgi:hypothetical protein
MLILSVAFALETLCSLPAEAQEEPVTISVDISGNVVPGGSVIASATVETNDGSTVEGYSWTQDYGVEAVISGASTAMANVSLGSAGMYKHMLVHVLSEPPIVAEQLPPNVPLPEGEFPGGLQNRFQIVAVNPFALEEAALVTLHLEVTTSSGTYSTEVEIHTVLPWSVANGVHNVPLNTPVLLHGKEQEHYDWNLGRPTGSNATLVDGLTKNPEFTPDVPGRYTIHVTDAGTGQSVSLAIYGGTFRGIIESQDKNGRPVVEASCYNCRDNEIAPAVFGEWAQTGHAEILTNNLNTSTHYGPNCFPCHSVGYDPNAANGGIDEAEDYHEFLDSGLLNNPGDNWTTMLDEYPESARLANIQCENCHGPQNGGAHTQGEMRTSLSSDMCSTCHGEPLRHARFQQWQLSAHANYELAIEEGESGSCARCHTGNGFLKWLPVLLGQVPGDPLGNVTVTWTSDEVHPQTCQTCHDPHNIGTTSGSDPNATVRISGDTPPLIAGFTATNVGRGAICMTCHNSRRGLRNDSLFPSVYGTSEAARAPHGSVQADVLMGQNAYFVEVGNRGGHSTLKDTCVTCHMEATPPPADLAYNEGGTNHTFYARNDICGNCHSFETGESLQAEFEEKMGVLQDLIEGALLDLIGEQIAAGSTVDLDGDAIITNTNDISDIDFSETRGRQAITVTFKNGDSFGPIRLTDVEVVPQIGSPFDIYDVADPALIKSGWNWLLFHSDGSHGVHNRSYAMQAIETSTTTLGGDGGGGGGGGTGSEACTADYVYWTEIAVNAMGQGQTSWKTDVIAKNMSATSAELEIVLHTDGRDVKTTANVDGGAQGVFEDIVAMMGAQGKGSLQICSDRPLEVVQRNYHSSEKGTAGHFLDGFRAGSGLTEDESARLLGLRQLTDAFRTNISITNTGMQTAIVKITLYDSSGAEVHSYNMSVGSGMVVQDVEPFKTRAGRPDLGWGYATVEIINGSGILASASVMDSGTNDAFSVPMKR